MNENEFHLAARAYLEDGPTRMSDHAVLSTLEQIHATRRRRSARPAWRSDRMRRYATLIAAAAAVLVVAVVGYAVPGGSGPAQPTNAAPPFGLAGNGIIALAKDGDIFAADRPGGDTRPLVAGPAFDFGPVFSPDGTRMVFRRETDAEPLLMVADADGTNVVQVMSEPLERWTFTPDSRSVIGVTWIDDEARIIVRPLDPAATPIVLAIDLRLGGEELFEWEGPRFRPASAREILVTTRLEPDGPRGIYVYDLATGAIRTIVEPAGPGWMSGVAWSPTGEDILYRLDSVERVVGPDGSGDRVRDDSPGEPGDNQTSPWSNDGTKVVVNRESDGIADVQAFVVSTTGSGGSVQLACGPTTAIPCAESWTWSPDDSILLGSTEHIVSSYGGPMETFLQADPTTGRVTELAWDLLRTPTWQRVAP